MNTYCVTEGCKVECPRSSCFKTMWAGKKWRMSAKFKGTSGSLAWRMSAKFKRTSSSLAWHECKVHMNVTTCPTPPHPNPPHPPNVNKTPRPSNGRGPTTHTYTTHVLSICSTYIDYIIYMFGLHFTTVAINNHKTMRKPVCMVRLEIRHQSPVCLVTG